MNYIPLLLLLVILLRNRNKIEQFRSFTQYGITMYRKRLENEYNLIQAHHNNKWIRDPSLFI